MDGLRRALSRLLSTMYVRGRIQEKGTDSESFNISKAKIVRYYSSVGKIYLPDKNPQVFEGRMEVDNHADTFVAGRNCLLMNYTERVCDVMPYSDDYEAKEGVPIVQVATGYTNMKGERFILIVNEALWLPSMENSLMNPNQLRDYGVDVEDNPYRGDPMLIQKISDHGDFVAGFKSEGTVIYLDTWTPTQRDLEEYPHVVLTSSKEWNPSKVKLPGMSDVDIEDLECRGIGSIHVGGTQEDHSLGFDDPYLQPIKIFDIQVFNSRIMKSTVIPVEMSEGPLSEDKVMEPRIFLSGDRHSNTTPEDLSEVWNISIEAAKLTLESTTQHHARSAIMPLSRRYRMDRMFEPKRLRCDMSTDTMDPRCDGMHGHRKCQVFGNKQMFAAAYPVKTGKSEDIDSALKEFINDFGAPETMTMDGARSQVTRGSLFMSRLRRNRITPMITPPHRPNMNPCETVIRELRKRWYRAIFRTNCPRALWTYGIPHFATLMRHTASNAANLDGKTPIGAILGETPDISHLLDFGWYNWVWFKENAGLAVPQLGRFLGIADSASNIMSYYVLPESGIPVIAGTVQRMTYLEQQTDANKERMKSFSSRIADKFKEGRLTVDSGEFPQLEDWEQLLEDDEDFAAEFNRLYDNLDVPEADDTFDPDSFDTYLNMELNVDQGGGEHPQFARVTKRLKDHRGNPIGTAHDNPILDTRMYEVEFADGQQQAMSANVIAENMFASVDEEGHRHLLLDSIVDFRKTGEAVDKSDAFVTSSNGTQRRRETTKGFQILCQWKDGSTTWSKMKDVKDSYPVQLAEFAMQNGIADEPAFAWWVPYTLKKKSRIISKIKSKYWQRTHKYGIRIPKTVQEAISIDNENGNNLWWDALLKEMKNVRPAFEVYEGDIKKLVGYQEIKCHVVWDIKLGENFRRKARLVAGGHVTNAPSSITYSSVVSRDSVRIALTIAALNDLDILACDIQNAYLTADCREKIFTKAGPEFGSEAGKIMIVRKALYGLKSSGAAFRALLASTIWDLGFRPTRSDPDVWLKPGVKPDGSKYYEMILCYVDDVIAMSSKPILIIDGIRATFRLKDDKAEVPEVYLGGDIKQVETASGTKCWTLSSEKYIKTAIANVEEKLSKSNLRLPSKCITPFVSGYHPSEDVTKELDSEGTRYYQELIGVLRWAIELGRVDILLEVALLSTHLVLPRAGHLQQLYHIFGYLKNSPRRRLYFDPGHPNISESRFQKFDWIDFYKDASEDIPLDMPEPRGREVSIHCFVDASHASDKENRRSQTGILIFINKAPIIFYSKRQNSVETSTFGSEFTAMKQAVELLKSLRYKLRMFGVPMEGPASVYCDNEAVYKNVANPSSVLSKKMHSISYHFCREAVAADIVRIAKEDTATNLSDLFTKILSKARRDELLDKFMY